MPDHLDELFEEVLRENKQRIYRICGAYARDQEDRQDLFQEVLLNVWKSLGSFQGKANVNTWLYRVTLNVCLQYALKLNRQQKQEVRLQHVRLVADSADAGEETEKKEKVAMLYRCIARLNETDRTLILLFLEELPHREIAEVIGITENNVSVRLNRIKKRLYHCLTR
ncbi:MAG: sigma-70 family RNA polymerase sigma factor [Ferruginibacter sp.]|nr:sigma-70 family RNA polymerase sigma factor [Cytophagales bacterium]